MASQSDYMLKDSSRQRLALHAFARRYQVGEELYMRAKRFIDVERIGKETVAREVHFLNQLPDRLKQDLLLRAHSSWLIRHPFLSFLNIRYPSFVRHVCGLMTSELFVAGDLVCVDGEACEGMRIVQSGQLLYLHGKHIETDELHEKTQKAYLHGENQILRSTSVLMERSSSAMQLDSVLSSRICQTTMDRAEQLRSGTFLSEAVLWTLWEHCRDLTAAEVGSACLVSPKALMDVLIQHPEVHWLSILYARQFFINLNKYTMSDVFEPPDVHQWEPEAIDAGANEDVDLPFKDELPPHINAAVVWACMVLAQDVARNGLDENRPHHGFTVIVGNTRALVKCGRSGFNPFHGHDLSVLSPGVTDLLRRNAFHTDGCNRLSMEEMKRPFVEEVIKATLLEIGLKTGLPTMTLFGEFSHLHINLSGKFIFGGPQGDAGLTVGKIIINTHGG
mmetsp:Transcript_21702/g.42359  ORF Transcript_21702/g.42359 Transcript_21702/m.42359 type:complete len:448 (-) Transcript_21702:2416-3759(-)